MEVLWLLLAVAVCAGLLYIGYRMEPHHVSKDGTRFLTTGQRLSQQGTTDGRKREVWVSVQPNGQLQVDVKRRMHHDLSYWSIEGKAPEPPPRREVYVLRSLDTFGKTQRMTIKVPAHSRSVAVLDEVLSNRSSS